jgi:hypothetical protein
MTDPQASGQPDQKGPPPFDPAHPQIGNQVPQWLFTGRHKTPDGDLMLLTIRVPNATVTAVLSKQDAQKWIDRMQEEVDAMSSLSIAPAGALPFSSPPMNSNGRPFG